MKSANRFHPRFFATAVAAFILAAATIASAQFQVLHTFAAGRDGAYPNPSLAIDNAGNVYGTTQTFGPHGYGTVYELVSGSSGWTYKILYGFCAQPSCTDGAEPYFAGVVLDSAGNLYGTTQFGGAQGSLGTVFQLKRSGGVWAETVLHSFSGGNDGDSPIAGVILDKAGNVYGVTNSGLSFGHYGTVFQLTNSAGGWTETVLRDFTLNGHDGNYPGLGDGLWMRGGKLLGTTSLNGDLGQGAIFQFTPTASGGWIESVPYDSGHPFSIDKAGKIYGVSSSGSFGFGSVFEFVPTPSGWTTSPIYDFSGGTDGAGPFRVISDGNGNLFGVTLGGGNPGCENQLGCGTVFELSQSSGQWTKIILYNFQGGADGGNPLGPLAIDRNGNLYGVTETAGSKKVGVVFEIVR